LSPKNNCIISCKTSLCYTKNYWITPYWDARIWVWS